ncbi:MICOS complex subunit Mic60 [Diaphorina citri]|uniref:MICOS complex subunit MIC60 n=1 Tax=Diaphorina citri TaxID=121845 RepID=A0A3Q0J999_DIACI|nr:MICOS complex subunit Mic60 [Diaphorina citri]
MYRIVACKNLLPFKKVPERLLKSTNTCNASLSRCYSGGGKKKSGHPILYTLGFTSVTVGGVVAYAKFDKDFRLWLEENLPGSDKFIEVVTEEKGVSVVDVVVNKYEDIKHEVETIKTDTLGKIEDITGFKFESEAPGTSSSPATSSLGMEKAKYKEQIGVMIGRMKAFEEALFEEKAKYKEQIGVMIGRMKAFEEAFKNLGYIVNERAYAEEAVQHSQALWSACQTLILRIQNSITPQDVKPLKSEIDAIKKSAAKSDTFVETICAAFPSAALSRGVYSEQALRSRFIGVQDSAYRVALVPDESASLPLVFLSYLQSLFIIRGLAAISPEEIRDEPSAKLNSLNTYEILERARYFVDRSDLLQAVKYMNLLQGGAKAVSQQWIADTLVYLETETAAKALLSHAASVSFVQ